MEISTLAHDLASHSSDASIFTLTPTAVAYPKNTQELQELVVYARKKGLTLHPWGAGTSRGGQPLGTGLVIDFRKYMKAILDYDPQTHLLRVQPGVTYAEVQKFLKEKGRSFPPDPSYHQCTIGGMVANNAAGIHSVKYGGTVKHIRRLEFVTAAGNIENTEANSFASELQSFLQKHAALIRADFPRVEKNSSGYNLDQILDCPAPEALCKLFTGSEGTLALFSEITLNTVALPKATALGLLYFAELSDSLQAAMDLRSYEIAACELVDKVLLDLHAEHEASGHGPKHAKKIVANPYLEKFYALGAKALLVVEMEGESLSEAQEKLVQALRSVKKAQAQLSVPAQSANQAWDLRRHSSPILNKLEDGKIAIKPLWAVEDVCLPKENFLAYVREQEALFAQHGLVCSFFGHAASCNLHIDPVASDPRLALKEEKLAALYEQVAQESYALVVRHGGSISGEHGDGLLRTKFLPMQYPKTYSLFAQVKKIFDPDSLLNPGKIVGA